MLENEPADVVRQLMRTGIKCPVDGELISDAECLACAMGNARPASGEKCAYPYELLAKMMDGSGRSSAGLSATMLTGCKRQTWLQDREPWHLDPDKAYAALRGSVSHAMIEGAAEPGSLTEIRFEAEFEGTRITGQIDKLHLGRRQITDFKTKAEEKKPVTKPQADHVLQLNTYRWLVKHGWPQVSLTAYADGYEPVAGDLNPFPLVPGTPSGIEIEQLELVYWTFGWVKRIAAPILPDVEVEAHIRAGIAAWRGATPPPVPIDLDPIGRTFREPSVFCTSWCPVRDACLDHLFHPTTTPTKEEFFP